MRAVVITSGAGTIVDRPRCCDRNITTDNPSGHALAPRANLAALSTAEWDPRLMLLAEDLNRAAMLLREPHVAGFTQQLFATSGGFAKLQLAPISSLNPLGTMYFAAWNPPGNVRQAIDALTGIVERLHQLGEA